MIKRICIAFLMLIVFCVGMGVVHYQTFPYLQLKSLKQHFFPNTYVTPQDMDYYERKVSSHKLLAGQQFDMLFLGDSLIDEAEWSQLLPAYKVANFGVNADTTEGMLGRLGTVTAVDVSSVFIMAGLNDIFQKVALEDTLNNYQVIVERLLQDGKKVYLFSCLYLGSSFQHYTPKVKQLNYYLQELAKSSEGIVYVDLNYSLALDSQLNPSFTNDDHHLNGAAYQRWLALIREKLAEQSQ